VPPPLFRVVSVILIVLPVTTAFSEAIVRSGPTVIFAILVLLVLVASTVEPHGLIYEQSSIALTLFALANI
jgi:hypothetical protein